MNQPPSGDGDDDMERRFQSGLKDDGGPSETVRRAILDHASRMAVEHARGQPGGRRPAMLTARRRNTIFGALAAAVFAGLLVVPLLLTPVVHRQGPVAQGPVAPPPNQETASHSAQAPPPQSAQVPRPAELQRNNTAYSGAGAQRRITADADKPKEAAGPAAKIEPQAVIGGALSPAAPPAAPAMQAPASDAASVIAAAPAVPSRQLARTTTSSVERGEFFRGAAAAGNLTAVNAVLSSSFDVDARDQSGRTALMLAILNGHADVVDVLLAHGAAVNAVDTSGVRPLQMARIKRNEAIIDSLLRAGAH
ncbi:MAG: ankyrin repeat domain-containing protein [Steroidobacteraceae bacterium]